MCLVEQPHAVVAVLRVRRVDERHELGLGFRAREEARARLDDLDGDLLLLHGVVRAHHAAEAAAAQQREHRVPVVEICTAIQAMRLRLGLGRNIELKGPCRDPVHPSELRSVRSVFLRRVFDGHPARAGVRAAEHLAFLHGVGVRGAVAAVLVALLLLLLRLLGPGSGSWG